MPATWINVELVDETPLEETVAMDGSVRATTSQKWLVESSTPMNQDEMLAATYGGATIPARLASLSATRPNCRARKRSAERETSHKGWVLIDYEDPTDGSSLATLPTKAARISTGASQHSEQYQVDAEGQKVCNAANEVFDQMPMRQAGVAQYTIKKYVNATVKAQIKAALHSNNDATKTIDGDTWAADELFIADCSFEPVDGSSLWDATIVIQGKRGGWKDVVLNVGYRDASGMELWVVKDVGACTRSYAEANGGDILSKPWPLTADGFIKPGTCPEPDSLEFWPYPRHAWTGVPLS